MRDRLLLCVVLVAPKRLCQVRLSFFCIFQCDNELMSREVSVEFEIWWHRRLCILSAMHIALSMLCVLLPRGSFGWGLVSIGFANVITNVCLARCRWHLKSGDTVLCALLVRRRLLYLWCVRCSQEALSGEAWFLLDLPKWSRTYVSRGVGEIWNLVTPS